MFHDTPFKRNSAATGVFMSGTLGAQRIAVMKDLGNIPEVTVDFMLDHIVPNSGINVEHTVQALKRKGILSDAGWGRFVNRLPKDVPNESIAFEHLGSIYQQIVASTAFDVELPRPQAPPLVMTTRPDKVPISETRNRSRPDGCGQLISSHPFHTSQCGYPSRERGEYHWFDITYAEEYKRKNTMKDLNDNVEKILWTLHHMMNVDHRRRFAFGVTVTIENTDTRIWFCCRELVFVTRAFDFMEEPAKLVRLISSLAYADAEKLGYDPTMKVFWKNNSWNHWITIEGKDFHGNIIAKIYQTTDTIADTSYDLRGRATRIYEAYDVETPEAKIVIKDSWVAANGSNEGDTLREILDGTSEDEKAMFLTVLLHGVVTIHGRPDLTRDLVMNGYQIVTEATVQSDRVHHASVFQTNNTSKIDLNPASLIRSPHVSFPTHQSIKQPRLYGPKVHYRIVFKERGDSLHSLSHQHQLKLPLAVRTMNDILKALAFLTKRGYVHQDINPANIIIHEGRAKLNDLEFAQKHGADVPKKRVLTGNYNFMPVEVANKGYIYHAKTKFFHNPWHDLESLWWVGVWFLFHRTPGDFSDVIITRMKVAAKDLFNNNVNPENRRRALILPGIFTVDSEMFRGHIEHLAVVMEQFRAQLDERYKFQDPHSSFTTDIHQQWSDLFEKVVEKLRNDETQLWPLISTSGFP